MNPLDAFITTQVFSFLIVFVRLGGALMILPGFSDSTVPMPIRLFAGLAMSLVLTPVAQRYLPVMPGTPVAFALLLFKELLIGIFIGLMSQVIINSLNVAGVIIAHATSLSSAFIFNPQQASQVSVITGFLSITSVVMIFVTDLHHMLILGILDSYRLFSVGGELAAGDMGDMIARSLGESFRVGVRIAAPFVLVSMGVFIGMGLVSRLVPQIQVFILSIPVQVITGVILLMTTLSAMMMYFLSEYQDAWMAIFSGEN
jgi:flagellar biosynthetic protein FliR